MKLANVKGLSKKSLKLTTPNRVVGCAIRFLCKSRYYVIDCLVFNYSIHICNSPLWSHTRRLLFETPAECEEWMGALQRACKLALASSTDDLLGGPPFPPSPFTSPATLPSLPNTTDSNELFEFQRADTNPSTVFPLFTRMLQYAKQLRVLLDYKRALYE